MNGEEISVYRLDVWDRENVLVDSMLRRAAAQAGYLVGSAEFAAFVRGGEAAWKDWKVVVGEDCLVKSVERKEA